jgi:hypothetical protein
VSALLARRLAAAREHGRPPAAVLDALGGPAVARRALEAGEALPDVIARHRLLPEAFVEAFRATDPGVAHALAGSAARAEQDRRRFRWVAGGALGTLATVLLTLALGTALGLRPLHEVVLRGYVEPPDGYLLMHMALNGLFSGKGVVAQVILLALLFAGLDRIWARAPSGRRVARASAARALAALLGAGLSAERALRAAASVAPHLAGTLTQAADRVAGGAPVGEVLAGLDLAPTGLGGLWSLAERRGTPGGRLADLAEAFAQTLEAERDARMPITGRGFWILHGVVAGALVLTFGLTLVSGWLLVLPWPG